MDAVAEQQPGHKYCRECGAIISAQAEICPKCGVRQMAPPAQPSLFAATTANGKSKVAAALFALFLGGLGIHKFYLGRVGWGVLYLCFCWTIIPGLVAFIEGILYLVMSDEEFNRKYGQS